MYCCVFLFCVVVIVVLLLCIAIVVLCGGNWLYCCVLLLLSIAIVYCGGDCLYCCVLLFCVLLFVVLLLVSVVLCIADSLSSQSHCFSTENAHRTFSVEKHNINKYYLLTTLLTLRILLLDHDRLTQSKLCVNRSWHTFVGWYPSYPFMHTWFW